MPTFVAEMQVVHREFWHVEAKDIAEARSKIEAMHDDVVDDDSGGEVVDVEIVALKADGA